jgi:RNA polymerase sigma factor (sigma-70 family)
MIDMNEAQRLMKKFIELRTKANETKSPKDIEEFRSHEQICIEKFKYLVTMRTSRYKQFSNYEDLNQEGMEALLKAMKNYNPKRGNWFWWSHHYVSTRISRSANLHTTIRYPLKIAKSIPPHKETIMPIIIEDKCCPDKELEITQTNHIIKDVMVFLTDEQKNIINLAYGFDGDKPMSINKICKRLNISRLKCLNTINDALAVMREQIKI